MDLQTFKQEIRLLDIKYDPWGTAMEAFFECAARLYERSVSIPRIWQYRPGATSTPTDPESYWHEMFISAKNSELIAIGNILHRHTSILALAGKSY